MTSPALALATTTILALALAACQTTEQPETFTTAPPPAPAAPPAPPTPEELFPDRPLIDYTIQPGDSLWLIAENHKIPVADIRTANAIAEDDNKIIAGKTLRIPLPADPSQASPDATPPIPTPDLLDPSPLPDTLDLPPTQPFTSPSADSGLPAPPVPPDR